MTTQPDEDWFVSMAEMYRIDVEEAHRRWDVLAKRVDDPRDPICIGCARRPGEIDIYVEMAGEEECTPVEYVLENEGTLNATNGHFLCDMCYIINGQPSSPSGWKAP